MGSHDDDTAYRAGVTGGAGAAGGAGVGAVMAFYLLLPGEDGRVRMMIRDGAWSDRWDYESWAHLLATQTFSPHAGVFVRLTKGDR